MALEIERRYVVKNTDWQTAVTGQQRIRQGFWRSVLKKWCGFASAVTKHG